MLIKFDDGTPINLEQMLLAKEKRVENQKQAMICYKHPIISLSLVIPGAIKNSSGARYLFDEAIKTLHHCFLQNDIAIINEDHYHYITGSEAIIAIKCSANVLKKYCIDIENNHPLGRLWDIDVIDIVTQKSLSRSQFDNQPRQCLVCHKTAKLCGRAKRHSIDEIFTAIENKIEKFQKNKSDNNHC
ncbi:MULTISPECIES: citrate lyase holo-[acyl-carrier protein] synthase [unclassified Gilliamella]|uniref:citrate lyase holo-[acyl-carrier protein] synthase n=1 Tax=unclassified Gilliamella TaxID=2685620 RepID=UPI00159ED4F9|nr:citrate lyase holo-[acyl-carrier protein] synthase [Gilliamella apicola]